ncbi:DNA cytosine methyltransferase [Nocardioides sp. GXQ0305]|uniref:DNA cytosine methyltransferase n=1 Tax=Nocardioides sp. GXQ0305 TaxID=3423912 RepID=UPI003D7DA2A0
MKPKVVDAGPNGPGSRSQGIEYTPGRSAPNFSFADVFAGIGGFHAALAAAGGQCVGAVEIDPDAARVYMRNWGRDPLGDITEIANEDRVTIDPHDVLAAGYPCQPFSKSGFQRGMDEARGTLFWNIARIAEVHQPKVLLLENVRNVAGPRHKHEWEVMVKTLRQLGYRVADEAAVMSPHLIPPELGGRPQVRERVFVTATFVGQGAKMGDLVAEPVFRNRPLDEWNWNPQKWDLEKHLPLDPDHHAEGCDLTAAERHWIKAWDEFVQIMWERLEGHRLPGFPIWADEWVHRDELEIDPLTPAWKRAFLVKNSELYSEHKDTLDEWMRRWEVKTPKFPPSRRKFEWQAQDTPTLWECVMHFRPSGIRAKKPTYLPALVAITQTSIIGPRERRLSPREAARLQGLPDWFDFGAQRNPATYKQLGNGVNAGVVWQVLKAHVARDKDLLEAGAPGLYKAVSALPDSPDAALDAMR